MNKGSSLADKTRVGIIWSAIERFSVQGVQFLFSILLARLLSPEDYGIIAMPMIFLQVAQVFIDSGFSSALIRKPDLTENDLTTAFYFNIMVGLFFYVVLFFTSPLISGFYNTPILSDLLKVTALTTLFTPLCAVQLAILTIKLDFKTQAKVSLASQICTGVIGVVMAYNGFGVWALAISQAAASFIRTVLLWYFAKWRPRGKWSMQSLQYLWTFGSKLMAAGLIDCLYQNIYTVVIGKVYSKSELGYYTRAQNFAHLPTSNMYGIIRRVTFPILSTIQENKEQMMKAFKKIFTSSVFVIFPVMICLAGSAEPLFSFLLTDKWLPAVPYFQILCFAMMWLPVDALNLNLLTVNGRSDLFLKLEIIKKLFGVIVLVGTIKLGTFVLCIGYAGYCLFEIMVDSYYTGKLFNYGFFNQMKDISTILLLCGLVFLICFMIERYIPLIPLIRIIIEWIIIIKLYRLTRRQ